MIVTGRNKNNAEEMFYDSTGKLKHGLPPPARWTPDWYETDSWGLWRSTNDKHEAVDSTVTEEETQEEETSLLRNRHGSVLPLISGMKNVLLGLTLVACDNIVIFKKQCISFCCLYLKYVGLVEGLLSELGAVGSFFFFFHSTVTTARY